MTPSPTPLMQQYREIKSQHPNAIVLFRMGEFYEMFYEDAETAARVLGLTLTSRNNGGAADVPLAGVPVKAINDYLPRLVQQGFRVAICEQMEDPKLAKGVVRREVVETVTPGVALSDDLLDRARNNFICALSSHSARGEESAVLGIAAADVSTGEFRLAIVASDELDALLARFAPREILVATGSSASFNVAGALVTERDGWQFDVAAARDDLVRAFDLLSLDGLGIGAADAPAIGAAGALVRYLRELQPGGLPQLARPTIERPGGVMPLDEMTRRNLELTESLRGGGAEGTLLSVLDRTSTPMGARLLRQWLLAPLTERSAIDARLDAVAAFANGLTRAQTREALDGVRDIERLAAKAASGRSTPRELRALGESLARLPELERAVRPIANVGRLQPLMAGWLDLSELAVTINSTLVERPPITIGEDPTIAVGHDQELDELRSLRDGGKDAIARIQRDERERTGIASLKVGFNKVFGYYIEVTSSNLHLVPGDYQRRQTISNGERFVTPALKEYEAKVLSAAERIETRERQLFDGLRARAGASIRELQAVSRIVSELDVLSTFSEVAALEGYARPEITDDFMLEIRGGRHPVVERMMPRDKFIPNDVSLPNDARMVILTGPNMAGKSTILRQIGLIALMAQIGCFVPASSARVGIIDRIFTRVGASDNLVRGQSTFMVEMSETSAILHTATTRSLVLLDEIGRGTATYDGVSIAWAVTEFLHNTIGCKTVFATHYHELTQLADELAAVRNFNVAVREVGDQILFLHRLQPGGADRSYGIEVGRLAGLPADVIARARMVLHLLEGEQLVRGKELAHRKPSDQLGLFSGGHPERTISGGSHPERTIPGGGHPGRSEGSAVAHDSRFFAALRMTETLASIDVNTLTPLEALSTLADLIERAKRA